MAAGRVCLLLVVVVLLAVSAAAAGPRQKRGILTILPPPAAASKVKEAKEINGTAESSEHRVDAAEEQEQGTSLLSRLLGVDMPPLARVFFNYGAALTLLTYITMGVGYFYGPYSVDALLAEKRQSHRINYLLTRLNATEGQVKAQEEQDYGYYVGEEIQSLHYDDNGGYGGYEEYSDYSPSSGYEPDSYSSYQGQISRRSGAVPQAAGFEARGGRMNDPRSNRRLVLPFGAGGQQRRRLAPAGQYPAQRYRVATQGRNGQRQRIGGPHGLRQNVAMQGQPGFPAPPVPSATHGGPPPPQASPLRQPAPQANAAEAQPVPDWAPLPENVEQASHSLSKDNEAPVAEIGEQVDHSSQGSAVGPEGSRQEEHPECAAWQRCLHRQRNCERFAGGLRGEAQQPTEHGGTAALPLTQLAHRRPAQRSAVIVQYRYNATRLAVPPTPGPPAPS